MSAYFITGAGTEIGKTHIAAGMIRNWRDRGIPARALKPVATGYQPAMSPHSDAGILLRAMGMQTSDAMVATICPWRFPDPISPDMASARFGKPIAFNSVLDFCRAEITRASVPLLVEGIGGAMVPLDDRHTVRDWIAALGIPAIVVAGGYLGTISHTLCAIEALRARGVSIAALVLNPMPPLPVRIEATRDAIVRHSPDPAMPVLIGDSPEWDEWMACA